MEHLCMVSVIIPVYNVEAYIEKCLDSFAAQTLTDIEIICVDDGSSDRTCDVIEEYARRDPRITLLRQPNSGAGIARNNGLKHAKGKYVYFFDGDDYCLPTLLEKTVARAEAAGADIVVLDYYRVDEQTHEETFCEGLKAKQYPSPKATFCYRDVPDTILSIVNPAPWNKVYNREFVMETKLEFLGLSSTNDITFCALSVAMARRVAYVREPLMYYRINRKNSITSHKESKLNNVLLAVDAVVKKVQILPYAQEIRFSVMYFVIGNLLAALDNYAGKPFGANYRSFYGKIRKVFASDIFDGIDRSRFQDKKRLDRYMAIRDTSYGMFVMKTMLSGPKAKIKAAIKMIAPETARRSMRYMQNEAEIHQKLLQSDRKVEKKLRDQSAKILEQGRLLAEQKRVLERLSNQMTAIEAMVSAKVSGVTQEKREKQIIVSLTSFPARICLVPQVLERLMNQTLKPDRIILWLSEDQFPCREDDLPIRLVEMKNRGLEIEWLNGDIRAYKKLLPALKRYPEELIITVDDDLLFGLDMVESLYEGHRRFPDAIIASRVHRVRFDEEGRILPYMKWEQELSKDTYQPRGDLFFTGGAGTLYPPHVFDDEVFNLDVIREHCPYADDVWMNVMAKRAGVSVVHTAKNMRVVCVPGSQEERLYSINIVQNDVQLQALSEYYGCAFYAPEKDAAQ